MWNNVLASPMFGLAITMLIYFGNKRLYDQRPWVIFNPLMAGPLVLFALLHLSGVDLKSYQVGGDILEFFVGPATVALAIPLYKQLPLLRKNLMSISAGIVAGALTGIVSTIGLLKVFGGSHVAMLSLAGKSVTMPIAIGITEKLGGNINIIVFGVMVAGTFGGLVGPEWLKLLRVRNQQAIGLAIGTAAHAGGTARAVQLGEVEGSFSGVAIGFCGLVTAILAPWLVPLLL